jgi:putative ABC transport system ATP-binding protein
VIRLIEARKVFNSGRPNEFTAVTGVSLTIEANRITVFRGPSGSGKTTLLSLIGCMVRPTSGRVALDGLTAQTNLSFAGAEMQELEVTSLPERFLAEVRRKTFGFVFQRLNLVGGLTLLENVMLPACPLGEKHRLVKERALSLLQLLGIDGLAASKVEWLSGGEAQRAAIARAVMNDPPVIIADEPTAHLDSTLSKEFMDIMATLKARGKTIIVASHDPLVFASPKIDRVIAVRDGKVDVQ